VELKRTKKRDQETRKGGNVGASTVGNRLGGGRVARRGGSTERRAGKGEKGTELKTERGTSKEDEDSKNEGMFEQKGETLEVCPGVPAARLRKRIP